MKIKPEHYNFIKNEIAKLDRKECLDHRLALKKIKDSGDANGAKIGDVEERFRFDLLYKANLSKYVSDELYSYLNDTDIDTALKKIMHDLGYSDTPEPPVIETEDGYVLYRLEDGRYSDHIENANKPEQPVENNLSLLDVDMVNKILLIGAVLLIVLGTLMLVSENNSIENSLKKEKVMTNENKTRAL